MRSLCELEVAISVEILKKDYAAAEQFALIKPGTFSSFFDVNREPDEQEEALGDTRKRIDSTPVDTRELRSSRRSSRPVSR
jgi:hypothetical protein